MSRSRKKTLIYAGSTRYSRKKKWKTYCNRVYRRRPIELSDVSFKRYTCIYIYDISDFHYWLEDTWKNRMK